MEPDMVFTLSPVTVTGAGLPPVGGGPGGREGRVRVRLPELTLSLTTEFLELGLDVLTGRALRGAGGGILAGTSSLDDELFCWSFTPHVFTVR